MSLFLWKGLYGHLPWRWSSGLLLFAMMAAATYKQMTTLQRLSELVPQLSEADRLALLEQVQLMLSQRQDQSAVKRRIRRAGRVSLR
jgi:hypothetical protein